MRGSDVIEPWPISVAGDMIEIVPSAAMLTQGLMLLPFICAAVMAASAMPARAATKAKLNPSAPIMTCGGDVQRFCVCVMAQASRDAR